jgi:hypothetical protein
MTIRRRSGLTAKMIRHDPTRRRYRPRYSPRKSATSPDRGSLFISFSTRLIRSRSRAGSDRTARWTALASSKSQFMLEVFEADTLAALQFLLGAAHRLDFLRQRILDWHRRRARDGSDISTKRFSQHLRTAAMLASAYSIKFFDELRRQRNRQRLRGRRSQLNAPGRIFGSTSATPPSSSAALPCAGTARPWRSRRGPP